MDKELLEEKEVQKCARKARQEGGLQKQMPGAVLIKIAFLCFSASKCYSHRAVYFAFHAFTLSISLTRLENSDRCFVHRGNLKVFHQVRRNGGWRMEGWWLPHLFSLHDHSLTSITSYPVSYRNCLSDFLYPSLSHLLAPDLYSYLSFRVFVCLGFFTWFFSAVSFEFIPNP